MRGRLSRGWLALPVTLGLALAGCAVPKSIDPAPTGAIAQPQTQDDFEKAVVYWGQKYAANPKDRTTALNYAGALRRTSRSDQAVAVLQKTAIYFPDDREVLAAYGKALASAGNLQLALDTVRRAQTADRPDWQLLSAEATILDQMGENQQARKLYAQALDFRPNEPSILSNYGMSFVLTGELPQAEKWLRKAIAVPGADSRVRQNLALAVGLQGRFDEAQQIAAAEISPDQAAANVAYLKQMLAQQNNWQKLKAGAGDAAAKKKPG
ncbi:tetratricopeptide repeat protein [soil metagenome]